MNTRLACLWLVALFLSASLLAAAPAAAQGRTSIRVARGWCERDLTAERQQCLKQYRAASSKTADMKKARTLRSNAAICLNKANEKYDNCMDPDKIAAMARDIDARRHLRILLAYEKDQDACKKRDTRAIENCGTLEDPARYEKCILTAIEASKNCYDTAAGKYEEQLNRIE